MAAQGDKSNPFRYGSPVPPNMLFGRASALRSIFSRLQIGDSTAVVGEPHIGKTSLLHAIGDNNIIKTYIGDAEEGYVFTYIDCQGLPMHYYPKDFWSELLDPLASNPGLNPIITHISDCETIEELRRGLKRLFTKLESNNIRLVLLIDEFETLLRHPTLCSTDFLGSLRSFVVNYRFLAVVAATRLRVADMNSFGNNLSGLGSPLFNYMVDIRLPPLLQGELDVMIDATLENTRVRFQSREKRLVYRLSGGFPFLAQMVCAKVYDLIVHSSEIATKGQFLLELRRMSSGYFTDIWTYLDEQSRDALYSLSQIEKGTEVPLIGTEAVISMLHERGFIHQRKPQSRLGEDKKQITQWNISSLLFLSWILEEMPFQGRFTLYGQSSTINNRKELRILMCSHFNMADARLLCNDLGLLADNIPGDTLEMFTANLISYFERHNQMQVLLRQLSAMRPNVNWRKLQ